MNNLPVSDAPTAAPADLGYVYALNDMFLCIGFTVGPILGSGLASAFQGGVLLFPQCDYIHHY